MRKASQFPRGLFAFARHHGSEASVAGITNDQDSTRSQILTYGQVNRLVTGGTTSSCGANCWGQTFGYDPWANLLTVTATGTATPLNLAVNANNQITTAPFAYDSAGNETADATGSYDWNAEGQLTNGNGSNYTYDGDGRRVEKSNGKLYWYGLDGNVLNETDATGSVTNSAFSRYIYLNGRLVARRDQANAYYYFDDQIGSSRSLASVPAGTRTPTLCYEGDFYPYGAESIVTNTCPQTYKWMGKERDAETGNDDFDARYYSSTYGRFLSADWSAVPAPVPYANLTNPQTLNLYAIVRDNPESYADLDGHCCDGPGGFFEVLNYINNAGLYANSALSYAKDYAIGLGKSVTSAFGGAGPLNSAQQDGLRTGNNVIVAAPWVIMAVGGARGGPDPLPNDAVVVRGGLNTPENFTSGRGVTTDANGNLQGVSVNSAPGKSVTELSQGIKNSKVGVTSVGAVRNAGGDVTPSPTPNNPDHCTMCGVTAGQASSLMKVIPNPAKPLRPLDPAP